MGTQFFINRVFVFNRLSIYLLASNIVSLLLSAASRIQYNMQPKVLFIGALLLICGLVKSDELNHDNDNYYLNGLSIEQEQPIGSRREGQTYSTDSQVTTVDRQGTLEETALISVIPGIAALLGVIVLAWVQANDQQNQQSDIDNICTSVKATGNTAMTVSATSDFADTANPTAAEVVTRLNLLENAINAFTTPDC